VIQTAPGEEALQMAVNPIEQIPVSGPANLKRSRKLHKPE